MDDRELLEWAAKAIGLEVWNQPGVEGLIASPTAWPDGYFNPLTRNADAFRLIPTLNLKVFYDYTDGGPVVWAMPEHYEAFDEGFGFIEYLDQGALAATRRVIVRAAAEIGKANG